jgi:hypothetical protein
MTDPTENTFARKSALIIEGPGEHCSKYTAEILNTEGLNSFQTEPLKNLSLDLLQQYSIVILTKTELNLGQADILREFVSRGGRLIAFQPDQQVQDVFGISYADTTLDEGHLKIDTDSQIGAGLTPETIRFHGSAYVYNLEGATSVADLIQSSQNLVNFPAVVSYDYGEGHSIAFSYDLPQNIVFTRQDSLTFAGQERDGVSEIREAGIFLGCSEPTTNNINQADEQMRLLSNAIEYLNSFSSSLQRLWYFPQFYRRQILLIAESNDSAE